LLLKWKYFAILCQENYGYPLTLLGASCHEEYLNKIKQAAYEEVKSVLTNGKLLLEFATLSIIESLRENPELCNFILYDISNNTTSHTYNYPSLMSSWQQQQQSVNNYPICRTTKQINLTFSFLYYGQW
jgi:hypothetical protein